MASLLQAEDTHAVAVGEATGLVVELFDAIMSTWRWVPAPAEGASS